jgi:hypothetical protein
MTDDDAGRVQTVDNVPSSILLIFFPDHPLFLVYSLAA